MSHGILFSDVEDGVITTTNTCGFVYGQHDCRLPAYASISAKLPEIKCYKCNKNVDEVISYTLNGKINIVVACHGEEDKLTVSEKICNRLSKETDKISDILHDEVDVWGRYVLGHRFFEPKESVISKWLKS